MSPEAIDLLLRCREIMLALPKYEPPSYMSWQHDEWQDEIDHGPRYLCGRWFGGMPEWKRMRYRRAIDTLEAAGLLTTWRSQGIRLTHVKLTADGLKLAKRLRCQDQQAQAQAIPDLPPLTGVKLESGRDVNNLTSIKPLSKPAAKANTENSK